MRKTLRNLDEQVVHVRTLVRECTDLVDELDSALDAAEGVFPPAVDDTAAAA